MTRLEKMTKTDRDAYPGQVFGFLTRFEKLAKTDFEYDRVIFSNAYFEAYHRFYTQYKEILADPLSSIDFNLWRSKHER